MVNATKGTASTRGATGPAPILLSPISVAHRSQMMETESGKPSTGNAIRDQWVANLQKKRMDAAAGTGAPIGNGNPLPPGSTISSNSRSNSNSRSSAAKKNSRSRSAAARAAKNRAQLNAATLEKSLNAHQRNMYQHSQFATMSSDLIVDSQIAMCEAEAHAYGQPSMLFSGLDCFELEAPSFSRLISSSLDGEFPLHADPSVTTKRPKSRPKRATKSSKKRPTHCLALEVDQPKPRTPRRKLNCGSATFDDFDLDYSVSSGFPGVGTPSNFRVDATTRHLWGQELELTGAGGYADTFLDLPTPRLALMSTSQQSKASTASNSSKQSNDEPDNQEELEHPRLIRTNSIEQEGLSYFLEQTNLDGDDGGHGEQLYQLAEAPLVSGRKSPFSGGSFFSTSATPRTAAAAAVVDECFGGKAAAFASTWPMPSPLGSQSRRSRMTPRDPKHPPEFETLTDEYKLTDIDHELDTFYLDTMEAIGNDLDLMSN
ncbi:sporangia induced conserved hypothetical protein [Phytophthora infestans T30-4]|uniref:Uncharacterized protein n=1 Tax=Phytophthora infestans (strain T30-4) TaxID=403677 RepID=D0NL79_PHYIT|nr:sporangia induced conserved hypothetical protein [Phytophthora infestans T30-4]EEY60397.1 sporangia induced conserved hypothetical protein [Phytophthora infestans T30-4]|eukprot:XP_002900193.1 sporangia induced conserved hypothetical protein [Phytophthora infestans T30-4]